MQHAPLQNKLHPKNLEGASKKDSPTDVVHDMNSDAGIPIFLCSGEFYSTPSPPFIQRQSIPETVGSFPGSMPLFLERFSLSGGPSLKDSLLGLRNDVARRPDLQLLLSRTGEENSTQTARTLARRSGGAVALPSDIQARSGESTQKDFSGVRVYNDIHAQLANAMLGTRAFTLHGDIYLGPGHRVSDPFVRQSILPHELVHVVQQDTPHGSNQSSVRAEREAHALSPYLQAGLPIAIHYAAGPGEQQGIIWWVVGGVAAIWFFSGMSIANAPGYRRDRRRGGFMYDSSGNRIPEQTISSPSTGEYLTEASTATLLFVASGPAGGSVRSLLGRTVFSQGTGLASRLVPIAAQGYTSFSMFDAAVQTAQGNAPWEDEFSWQRNQTFGVIGGATAPFLAGSAFYLLQAPAGAAPSATQLVVYYGTSFTGSGLIGAAAMQTMRPEFNSEEFLADFALFGLGGALWARSMPNTLVVTDPNAFVMVDQAGQFGDIGAAYVVQESESGLFTVTRVGNFGSVVEAMPSPATPSSLASANASDIIVDQASSSFATLNNPMISGYGVPLGRQPLYAITDTGDILLVERIGVSPTTGYLSAGGVEGESAFRTFFPSPSGGSISAWNDVVTELDNIYTNSANIPNMQGAMAGRGGRAVSVTVIEENGQITVNVGISGGASSHVDNAIFQLQARFPNYRFAPVTMDLETLGYTQGFRDPPIMSNGQPMGRPQGACAEPSVASLGQGQSMSTGWWSPTGRSVPSNYQVEANSPWMLPCESCRANSDIMFPPEVCEMPENPLRTSSVPPGPYIILQESSSSGEESNE